jgi:hypothetical protein
MTVFAQWLADHPRLDEAPLARALVPVVTSDTQVSTAGWPYLQETAYLHLRDRVPHILGFGDAAWRGLQHLVDLVEASEITDEAAREHFHASQQVVEQVLKTAAITAPPSLWLARHLVDTLRGEGLADRLLAGDVLRPGEEGLCAEELEMDCTFLSILGLLDRAPGAFNMVQKPQVRAVFSLPNLPPFVPAGMSDVFRRLFLGAELSGEEREAVAWALGNPPIRRDPAQHTWTPRVEEIELGHRLLPVVLGLASAGLLGEVVDQRALTPASLGEGGDQHAGILALFQGAGLVRGDTGALTPLGHRTLVRGPGPFGIIEAYHPYMHSLGEILQHGRGSVHLTRGSNVAASQRANRQSFAHANDQLDAFCQKTGWTYRVYIEHALGRGEATRQRFERNGDTLIYLGADLENAAIDAALEEQARGRLPGKMHFIRHADIGRPEAVLGPLAATGLQEEGAVMVVGNGFHEIRDQGDEGLIEVLSKYCAAQLVLVFTEETALSIPDQRNTAWNTYHPAFRYVHEKSGQGLRPSVEGPADPIGPPMPLSWTECAEQAGYVLLEAFSRPGRTVYPCPRQDGHNPSTSVIYFFVPKDLAFVLGLEEGEG